jgi:O-antigen/teichoic acid export membrane protein
LLTNPIPQANAALAQIKSLITRPAARAAGAVAGTLYLGKLLALLSFMLCANRIGAYQLGVFVQAQSVSVILSLLCGLGYQASCIRFITEFGSAGDGGGLKRFLAVSLGQVGASVVAVGAIVLSLPVVHPLAPQTSSLIQWAVALLPAFTVSILRRASSRALGMGYPAIVPDQIIAPILFAFFLVLWRVTSFNGASAAYFSASLISEGIGLAMMWPRLLNALQLSSGVGPAYGAFATLRISLSMLLADVARQSIDRIDVVIVGLAAGNTAAGIYAAAARLALVVSLPVQVVNFFVAPELSRAFVQGNLARLRRLVFVSSLGSVTPALFAALALVLFGLPILTLFGHSYRASLPALYLLLGGHVINAAAGTAGWTLLLTGYEKIQSAVVATTALAAAAIMFLLSARYGAAGGAAAYSICLASGASASLVLAMIFPLQYKIPRLADADG